MSTAGRVPIGNMPNVQGTTGTGQLVQNVNPESVFGYQQGLNNFNASIFGSQADIYKSQSSQKDFFGSILSGGAGAATGAFGTAVGTAAFAAL